jgi:protein TonB
LQKIAASIDAGHRLVSTLFAVTLFHGLVVLGVTFAPGNDRDEGNPAVEVVMLIDPDESQDNPDKAEYLAQTSQLGSGTTEDTVRPTSGELQPFVSEGVEHGDNLKDALTDERPSQDPILMTRAKNDPTRPIDPAENLESVERRQLAMQMTHSDSQALAELERAPNPEISGKTKRELLVSVNTRQSDLAEYLVRWKEKIERLGTMNFPTAARTSSMSGNPILEVALRSDGSLEEIIVLKSSGHGELDQAAMRILRLAAPFDPFPKAFRDNYDVLRFVYEWQFMDGKVETGAVKVVKNNTPP